jgi:hypothetical protein
MRTPSKEGKKMKPSAVGIVSAAILMVVVGVGFGIAQAGGNHSEQPVLSFEDMEALQQGSSSNPYYVENRPVLAFEDSPGSYAESRPVLSFEDFMQLRNPTGTGSLPAESNVDSSIVEIDGDTYYRVGGKLYGPY